MVSHAVRWILCKGSVIQHVLLRAVPRQRTPAGAIPPGNCRSIRYVEFLVMWGWAAKPLPRNAFREFYST